MLIDLHTHTCYSDGKYSPSELVKIAKRAGLSCIGITDHDNLDGLDEASQTGNEVGIEVVPGVEISAEHKGREVHVLGYFVDPRNRDLLNYLDYFREQRKHRAEKIVARLNELGVPLSFENILEKVNSNVSIGRPHVAWALLTGRFVDTYVEAYQKYIGDGKPACVKKPNITPKEAARLISNAGGLSFVAHPGKIVRDNFLIELIEMGIDGVEIVHPSHSPEDKIYFQGFAGQYFLLECGGSDFHGSKPGEEKNLGTYVIPEQKLYEMKTRLFQG